jgi:hypothetical protein
MHTDATCNHTERIKRKGESILIMARMLKWKQKELHPAQQFGENLVNCYGALTKLDSKTIFLF